MAVLVEYPFLEIRKILFENVTRRKPNHTLVNNNSVISETPLVSDSKNFTKNIVMNKTD